MLDLPQRSRPADWREFRLRVRHRWLRPFLFSEWAFAYLAYFLSRWSLLEVLEYAGRFSVLVAVIVYFGESGERQQQKHYQAWQVINTAEGKGGNGGRIDALEQLNADGVSLTGVDVVDAFLQGVQLDRAELRRADFRSADLRNAHFRNAILIDADFRSANLRGADLRRADLSGAKLNRADLTGADLSGANLTDVVLIEADLSDANFAGVSGYQSVQGLAMATLTGARSLPPAWITPALRSGAVPATLPSTTANP